MERDDKPARTMRLRWTRSPHFRSLLLLAILTTLPYFPALFGSQRLAAHDTLDNFYPWKTLLVREVRNGRLPLWNPYTFSGCPFVGNPQVAMFYPLDLPAFFISLERYFALFYALHGFLAAAAMYVWIFGHTGSARAGVVSGLAWSWCGYTSTNVLAGFTGLTSAAVYLPLAMLCVDRLFRKPGVRPVCFLALVMALQILAGHPQPVMYTGYMIVLYAAFLALRVYRRGELSLAQALVTFFVIPLALVFAMSLAAILVLPAIETGLQSAVRHGGVSYEYAAHDSVPLLHLATFVSPFFFGDPANRSYWLSTTGYQEIGGYPGILVILLAACAWRRRPLRSYLIGMTFISLLAALGSNAPLFRLLYYVVPGFRWFRVPGRLLLLFNFCLAALAGLGAADLLRRPGRRLPIRAMVVLGSVVILEVIAAVWLWAGRGDMANRLLDFEIQRSFPSAGGLADIPSATQSAMLETADERITTMQEGVVEAILWTAFGAGLLFLRKRRVSTVAVTAGGLFLLLADLGKFHVHLIPSRDAAQYRRTAYPRSPTVEFLQKDPGHFRVLVADDAIGWMTRQKHPELYPERLIIPVIETVRGYNPTILEDYAAYINRMQGWPEGKWVGGLLFLPFPDRMNRRMLDQLNVRYLLTYQPAPENFQPVLNDGGLNVYRNLQAYPRSYVVNEGPEKFREAEIVEYTPNRVVISARLEAPGILVLADTWFSGWKVKVDGKARELKKHEGIFRAVDLSAGDHEVVFQYAPASFRLGAVISAVSLLLLLGVCSLRRAGA